LASRNLSLPVMSAMPKLASDIASMNGAKR
jgi:hypothetical protein